MIGRILKIVSKHYTVLLETKEKVEAIVMGKVRLQTSPVAGDMVELICSEGSYGITKVLPRKNQLKRPAVANVDQALIVMSVKDPDFSSILVDRLSFLIAAEGIEPILIVSKTDYEMNEEVAKEIEAYKNGPMKVIHVEKDVYSQELVEILKGKISVLTGQSGSGKSTLLNTLEPSFQLATQEISKALGRGKHTTRHNELHEVVGGYVADTPGFSSLDFSHMSISDLENSVLEFRPYLGQCRFNDCIHQNEPGCAIKEAVSKKDIAEFRYQHYLSVLKLIQNRKETYL